LAFVYLFGLFVSFAVKHSGNLAMSIRSGNWPDYIILGEGCVQHHVGPRHRPGSPLAGHDVEAAGLSDLTGKYAISRSRFACHVVFFSLAGEGLVETPDGAWPLPAGTMMKVPGGCPARYRLVGPHWRILWFDLRDTEEWAWLRSSQVEVRAHGEEVAELTRTVAALHREMGENRPQAAALANLLAGQAVILLARELRQATGADAREDAGTRLRALFHRVEARLQAPWRVESLAAELGISPPTLHLWCRRHLGCGPMARVAALRLAQAKVLLAHSLAPVGDIAASVGYDNALNFSTAFRRQAGCAPREYRRQARGTPGTHPGRDAACPP
jgi:AraC-like DNA-binding protein